MAIPVAAAASSAGYNCVHHQIPMDWGRREDIRGEISWRCLAWCADHYAEVIISPRRLYLRALLRYRVYSPHALEADSPPLAICYPFPAISSATPKIEVFSTKVRTLAQFFFQPSVVSNSRVGAGRKRMVGRPKSIRRSGRTCLLMRAGTSTRKETHTFLRWNLQLIFGGEKVRLHVEKCWGLCRVKARLSVFILEEDQWSAGVRRESDRGGGFAYFSGNLGKLILCLSVQCSHIYPCKFVARDLAASE
ncbi:uncharacterized protein MYCFIDRAFT_178949 [Pseudocercospora fijiensis CIRAD86]|uniref:Uncharacterized protein n=1 Tax=Pseudocercospora fijiensis (strain CIRAD86) TaxID=383855 RepID=M3AP19_PSEFD|nr:uncharacterized protein MYCFIDRAFT_178949 [Pseudocercospora fijiensis CIRAD86]EME78858.1 hypothetical protein MYCFIDRAFT_178949 [Pseudocercospora fijiensis CIRAD86]